jgi:hypothetical protein
MSVAKTKKVSQKAVVGELQSLGLIGAGMIVGTIAGKQLDRIMKVDDTSKGLKKALPGIAIAAAGAIGVLKVKNTMAKQVLGGFGAAGVLKTARAVMPSVAFLNGTDGIGATEDVWRDVESGQVFPELPNNIGWAPAVEANGVPNFTPANAYNRNELGAASAEAAYAEVL